MSEDCKEYHVASHVVQAVGIMMPRGIQWWRERSFKQTELSLTNNTPTPLVFLSVFGMFIFTDLSAIDVPCYVAINSSGKKACTFLLSSFGLRAGLSYMTFFCSCLHG